MSRDSEAEDISETSQSLRKLFKVIEDYSPEVYAGFGITDPRLWALETVSQSAKVTFGDLSLIVIYESVTKLTETV